MIDSRIIYTHSLNVGFKPEGASIIANTLYGLSDEYMNSCLARQVFDSTYPKHVHGLFGSKELLRFRDQVRMNSFYPTNEELRDKLGIDMLDFKMLADAHQLSDADIREFFRDKQRYADETRDKRERSILRHMEEDGYLYDILTSKGYHEHIPAPENFRETFAKLIFTPSGGQPGYRLKMKRR